MKYESFPEPRINLEQLCLEGLENVLQTTRLKLAQDPFVGNDTNVYYPEFGKREPEDLIA